jgi:hypothetical protein
MTTALGFGASPQVTRHVRRSRSSSQRHSPSRVERENSANSVPNGMPHSCPIARHCIPQKQVTMIALRNAAPVSGGLGPGRIGRVPSAAMAVSSVNTASTKASTSVKAFHEAEQTNQPEKLFRKFWLNVNSVCSRVWSALPQMLGPESFSTLVKASL